MGELIHRSFERAVGMRAARACATTRSVTVVTDVPRPELGPRDILVRVRAAGVNHIDVNAVRDGYAVDVYAGPRDARAAWTPGREYSGVVVDVGRDVRGWAVGDEAYGATAPTSRRGAWAEVTAAPAHAAAKKPSWMTHEEACAIPFAALTAYRAMIGKGRARRGGRALVVGGGSAVGTAACALAEDAGCETTATANARDFEFLRDVVGVREVVDYAVPGFSLRKTAKERGWTPFDVAVDCVGTKKTRAHATDLLKYGVGTYVTLHGDLGKFVTSEDGMLIGALRGFGEFARKQAFSRWQKDVGYEQAVARLDPDAMVTIARLVESGKLRIPVGEILELDDIELACDALRDPTKFGKVVVKL